MNMIIFGPDFFRQRSSRAVLIHAFPNEAHPLAINVTIITPLHEDKFSLESS
jgi:hypothetical protein